MKYRDRRRWGGGLVDAVLFVYDWLGDQPMPERLPDGDTDQTVTLLDQPFPLRHDVLGLLVALPDGSVLHEGEYLIRDAEGRLWACPLSLFRQDYQEVGL